MCISISKILFSIGSFLAFLIQVQAQDIKFSVEGKVHYLTKSTYEFDSQLSGYTNLVLNDTVLIRFLINRTFIEGKTYSSYQPDYDLNVNVQWELSDDLSVRTGLGLNFSSFKYDSQRLRDINGIILEQDTFALPKPEFPGGNFLVPSCNLNGAFIGFIFPNKKRMLNLMIPLELEYRIIPDHLFTRLGLFFQTPLLGQTDFTRSIFNQELQDDGFVFCTNGIVRENVSSLRYYNKVQWGYRLTLGYQLGKNFNFLFGISKSFSNVFNEKDHLDGIDQNENLKPTKISIGVEYNFRKKEKS